MVYCLYSVYFKYFVSISSILILGVHPDVSVVIVNHAAIMLQSCCNITVPEIMKLSQCFEAELFMFLDDKKIIS